MQQQMGELIRSLRKECGLTQLQLAQRLHVSDKTISKWERCSGCPDIGMLTALSSVFGVDLPSLLNGTLAANPQVNGNMKMAQYFYCPVCGNLTVCTGRASVICCGRILEPYKPQKATEEQRLSVEQSEDDWFISSDHPMQKDKYISFVAFVTGAGIALYKQYPEWNLQLRLPKRGHGTLLWLDTIDGLFYQLI